jgi:hypothetical protein
MKLLDNFIIIFKIIVANYLKDKYFPNLKIIFEN